MMRKSWPLFCCLCLLPTILLNGCASKKQPSLTATDITLAQADSLGLASFLQLPEVQQDDRRRRAGPFLEKVEEAKVFEVVSNDYILEQSTRSAQMYDGNTRKIDHLLDYVDVAVGLDPSHAGAWLHRGRLNEARGHVAAAAASYELAWEAATRAPQPVETAKAERLEIALQMAWIQRDAGHWETGLAWLARLDPGVLRSHGEASLLKGLLLAGLGEDEAAMRISYGLPTIDLPGIPPIQRMNYLGRRAQKSDLLKRWLQAEVWRERCDLDLAWKSMGETPTWTELLHVPHQVYQDLGRLAELTDDYKVTELYALAELARPYHRLAPAVPRGHDPLIAGVPDERADFYCTDDGRYLDGSLVGFATASTTTALETTQGLWADHYYALALAALDACIRRDIQAEVALALRGRLRDTRGMNALAERDLVEARDFMLDRDLIDPLTSYWLGLRRMEDGDLAGAEELFFEAVAIDSFHAGAWVGLGAVRVQQGDMEGAEEAFTRTIAHDPRQAVGWYNRGLLRCQADRIDEGLADFKVAARLDPGNKEIARVHRMALQAHAQGDDFMVGTHPTDQWAQPRIDADPGSARHQYSRPLWVFTELLGEQRILLRAAEMGEQELASMMDEYMRAPSPGRRKSLAYAQAAMGNLLESWDLLVAPASAPLDPDEGSLLTWLAWRFNDPRPDVPQVREHHTLEAGFGRSWEHVMRRSWPEILQPTQVSQGGP